MQKQKDNGKTPLSNQNKFQSQAGQAVIEMVLLMVISVGLLLSFNKKMKDKKLFDSIIGKPWIAASGMIECGSWGSPSEVCKYHPNQINRSISKDK